MRLLSLGFVFALAACDFEIVDASRTDVPDPHSSPGASSVDRGGAPDAGCDVTIDRWKELLVIHRSVLMDRRARNDVPHAPWSFRTRMEELAGDTGVASFVASWIDQWRTVERVGPDAAPVTPRPAAPAILAHADLDRLPFRLIAIVNRLDLRTGELRFVYTATDATGAALAMTVIVEVPYPATRAPEEWAAKWHALAAEPFGASYSDALAALTTEITSAADPRGIRVRTNEIALGEDAGMPWELREFALDRVAYGRRLVQVPLVTTPRMDLARSPSLDSWIRENEARVRAGNHVLPGPFQAGAAEVPTPWFRWDSAELPNDLREAFSTSTCSGCHGGERQGDPLRFQHLAPFDAPGPYYGSQTGETQVSRWLHDPSGRDDELGRRSRLLARALCTTSGGNGYASAAR